MADGQFLETRSDVRPWSLPDDAPAGLEAAGLFLGRGRLPLEVAVASAISSPSAGTLRRLWSARHGNRPSPLLLVITHPGRHGPAASVCGPVPPAPAPVLDLSLDQVERIAETALGEPNRHAAVRFLQLVVPEADSELPGIRNVGLVATHELQVGVPARHDWRESCERAADVMDLRGRSLVETLGFAIEERGTSTYVLRANGIATAVAVFLEADETPEAENTAYGFISPLSAALARADTEQLPYVVVTRGPEIRLYAARTGMGVGRRGRAETYVEANLGLLPARLSGYLSLLFGSHALRPGGTLEDILASSQDFAVGLGARLRDRVYNFVVPRLAQSVARHRQATEEPVGEGELASLYEQALTILFRLLFIAYAEDKDLLPYRVNGAYQQNALKTVARQLTELLNADRLGFDPQSTLLWARVRELVRAVDVGRPTWQVPAYNGGLFSSESAVNAVGAELGTLSLSDEEFGPVLVELLVDTDAQGVRGPVDFRSLSVREFGTIYEGLLESGLAIAPVDLGLAPDGQYVPGPDADVVVRAGEIYLHNASGARKSTGTYFTKSPAVEHLLQHALEPALDRHLLRIGDLLARGEEVEAAAAFFDFRCADLSMGSAHFLVAAIDRIEARLSSFLAEHRIPGVYAELARLRASALEMLGEDAGGVVIETGTLIRRQVARRCVYGVDTNAIAVELARLGIWIHTFVPGLPLSYLSHNFVAGNSLTGIGTIDEAVRVLDPTGESDQLSLWRASLMTWIGAARDALARLARNTDATTAEVAEARGDQAAVRAAVEPAAALLDLLVAARLGEAELPVVPDDGSLAQGDALSRARQVARDLDALHFPVAFPEVFLRDRPGFDVVVGNPPWDKVRFEAQQFWVSRAPGLNALPTSRRAEAIERLRIERPNDADDEVVEQRSRERLQRYFGAAYHHQGRGHYDYAKLFVERAIALLADEAALGYVLPRQFLVLGGWSNLRELVLRNAEVSVVQARNRGGWLFDDIHHSYMVVFLSRLPASRQGDRANVWHAVTDLDALEALPVAPSLSLTRGRLEEFSDSLVIPWFESEKDVGVFTAMSGHPRLGSPSGWISGYSDARWDFSGSGSEREFVGPASDQAWRVLMSKHVEAFRIGDQPFERHVPQPERLVPLNLGVELDQDRPRLSASHPLIVFRYPSRNDDSRTLIATALPETGYLYSTGYAHGIRHPTGTSPSTILALLGHLGTFTCDWWIRRFTDRHVTAPVISNIPLPDWDLSAQSRASGLVTELLARDGMSRLPGGVVLESSADYLHLDRASVIVELEVMTLRGFGLSRATAKGVFDDFSERACPLPLRSQILDQLT